MPKDTQLHDSSCEMNQVLPSSAHHSIQAASPPVATGSAPQHVKPNAKRSGRKAAESRPSAPHLQSSRQVFSISDIQARFQAKRLAIANKPRTGRTRKSASSCSSAGSDCEAGHVLPRVKRSDSPSHSSSSESDALIASPPETASPPACVRPSRRLLEIPAAEIKSLGEVGCAVTRKRSAVEFAAKGGSDLQVIAAKRSRRTGTSAQTVPPSSSADHHYCWECGLSGGTMQVRSCCTCLSLYSNSLFGCSCAPDPAAVCASTRFAPAFKQTNSDGACARAAATLA